MADTFKLGLVVDRLANVLTLFDTVQVWRSTTGLEVDRVLYDDFDLVAGQSSYDYDDIAGAEGYVAWFRYYNTSNGNYSGFEGPVYYGNGGFMYVTVDQCRDEGLLDTVADGGRVAQLIERASRLIDKLTRNFFFKRTGTYTFDGNNGHILHLPNPMLSVTNLYINNQDTAEDTDYYKVYNGREAPNDHRHNPKIELRYNAEPSIFTGGLATSKFQKGYDQTVEGIFGFLESDDSVPLPIQQATLIMVMTWAHGYYAKYGSMGGEGGVGPLKRERTDDHEKEWHNPSFTSEKAYTRHYAVPNEVYDLIKEYHAPRAIGVTAVRWDEPIE